MKEEERKDFYDGQKLSCIFWPKGELLKVGDGPAGKECKSITVIMETGHMACVPWARAEYEDGEVTKYNLALAEGVKIQ